MDKKTQILLQSAMNFEDPLSRHFVIELMGELGGNQPNETITRFLKSELDSQNLELRMEARRALDKLNGIA